MPATLLIVDDEKNILLTLKRAVEIEGYACAVAGGGKVALEVFAAKPVDAVVMDVRMPDIDGLEVLKRMKELRPLTPVIMMSGHGSFETAVAATKLGAYTFLPKPIDREQLLVSLRNALGSKAREEEIADLKTELGSYEMVGKSPVMQRLYELIRKAAPSEGRVLITGENGSGKELIARAIHAHSRRSRAAFVKLNCAAVPHDLIESELFGHERGAFTGAVAARKGKFEQANGGTLFLDEIGDMPAPMQAKLLRVLQEGELERVGGTETLKVDVRVIAATNKDLLKEIEAGRFREDLYYRLNVVPIHAMPLRERRGDIPDLARAFLAEACKRNGRRPMTLTPEALQVLEGYEYKGNVRELKNLVERLVILSDGPEIGAEDVKLTLPAASKPEPTSRYQPGKTFHEMVEDAEREIILAAIARAKDNVTEAARSLSLERGHFYKKMKALGLRRGGAAQEAEGEEGRQGV
ncbi:MAG: sigma-54-dependent transcriptional regulator [Myxococcales bacterium]|jgi:two-component system nitrogen regulation response regulator NtrX